MIAVLGWVDGFGADTQVLGIFPTLTEAEKYAGEDYENCRYTEFEFGEVNFDFYEAKKFFACERKKKKRHKNSGN